MITSANVGRNKHWHANNMHVEEKTSVYHLAWCLTWHIQQCYIVHTDITGQQDSSCSRTSLTDDQYCVNSKINPSLLLPLGNCSLHVQP